MKALVVVAFVVLVLAHPAAAALVLVAELGVCAAAVWMIRRAYRRNPLRWRMT